VRQTAKVAWTFVIIVFLGVPTAILGLMGLPHFFRNPLVRNVISTVPGDVLVPLTGPAFPEQFSLLTGSQVSTGNAIEVLANGNGTFPRLWNDLRQAQRIITVQMYYAAPGSVADTIAGILAERARAGVTVYFLYDAFGAQNLSERYLEALADAGVKVGQFRPLRWYALDRANHRSHVRGIVIDGTLGYTGGFGFDDKWLGDGRRPAEWRETNVRFSGPAVAELQAEFVAKWAETTGELLSGRSLLAVRTDSSVVDSVGPAAMVRSAPVTGSTAAERLLAVSIAAAQKTLYITNSYFVPYPDFARLLADAARRGVDVRVLTNGRGSDVKTTWLAGRSRYQSLLQAGVRIYEYQPATLHSKTLVADHMFASVGTMNFDNRSLAYNDEVALVTFDSRTAATLDSMFASDIAFSEEIRLATFERRSWTARVLEWAASTIAAFL
jgi:cardiolipin synthase